MALGRPSAHASMHYGVPAHTQQRDPRSRAMQPTTTIPDWTRNVPTSIRYVTIARASCAPYHEYEEGIEKSKGMRRNGAAMPCFSSSRGVYILYLYTVKDERFLVHGDVTYTSCSAAALPFVERSHSTLFLSFFVNRPTDIDVVDFVMEQKPFSGPRV
ncbi:hypothetical protein CBL_09320 [Carabus blaptoides fortunei]